MSFSQRQCWPTLRPNSVSLFLCTFCVLLLLSLSSPSCRPLPDVFLPRSRPPHPVLPGHVTLLPSRKSLSTICLAGCDEFGGLAKQINSVKLMTLSVGINFARVCPPEMLHNPQRHLIYPVAEGRCVGRGRRVGGTHYRRRRPHTLTSLKAQQVRTPDGCRLLFYVHSSSHLSKNEEVETTSKQSDPQDASNASCKSSREKEKKKT